jgi:WD40 repeat protein
MRIAFVALGLAVLGSQAQAPPPPGTDIWLARLTPAHVVEQPINITARTGYDNQPSFAPDSRAMLFTSGTDPNHTDIYQYDFNSRDSTLRRLTETPEREYSPAMTPDGGISVIRVEGDGTQRLWRFARDGSSPTLLLPNVKPVGYHAWGDDGLVALFVLGDPNTLQVADVRTGTAQVVTERIGRSMHRIPNRTTISIVHTQQDGRWIKELNPRTRALTPLVRLPDGGDGDYAWTPDGTILMARDGALMRWSPRQNGAQWTRVADLAALWLRDVTRMAVSPDGRWIALVARDER